MCNTENIEAIKNSTSDKYLKILAIPEQFSPKHIQAILDGKIKDGDEVYIDCLRGSEGYLDENNNLKNYYLVNGSGHIGINHIKLFPIKKESEKLYSKNQILEKVNQWFREEASVNGLDAEPIDKWLGKNL